MTDTTEHRGNSQFGNHRGIADSLAVRSSAPFRGKQRAPDLDQLQLSTHAGGLVFLGPTAAPVRAIDSLLESPEVEAVQANGELLSSWITSPDEVLVLSRQVSSIVRSGRTAVVYLDSHLEDGAAAVPLELWDFVCCRMGRILVGLADQPSYVAVHGQQMLHGVLDAVEEEHPPTIGAIAGDLAVVQLTEQTMFCDLVVAVTPSSRAATAVVQAVDWFEAHRF